MSEDKISRGVKLLQVPVVGDESIQVVAQGQAKANDALSCSITPILVQQGRPPAEHQA